MIIRDLLTRPEHHFATRYIQDAQSGTMLGLYAHVVSVVFTLNVVGSYYLGCKLLDNMPRDLYIGDASVATTFGKLTSDTPEQFKHVGPGIFLSTASILDHPWRVLSPATLRKHLLEAYLKDNYPIDTRLFMGLDRND